MQRPAEAPAASTSASGVGTHCSPHAACGPGTSRSRRQLGLRRCAISMTWRRMVTPSRRRRSVPLPAGVGPTRRSPLPAELRSHSRCAKRRDRSSRVPAQRCDRVASPALSARRLLRPARRRLAVGASTVALAVSVAACGSGAGVAAGTHPPTSAAVARHRPTTSSAAPGSTRAPTPRPTTSSSAPSRPTTTVVTVQHLPAVCVPLARAMRSFAAAASSARGSATAAAAQLRSAEPGILAAAPAQVRSSLSTLFSAVGRYYALLGSAGGNVAHLDAASRRALAGLAASALSSSRRVSVYLAQECSTPTKRN